MSCHSLGVRLAQCPKVGPRRGIEPSRVSVVRVQLRRCGAFRRIAPGRPPAGAGSRMTGAFGSGSLAATGRSAPTTGIAARPTLLPSAFTARTPFTIRAFSATPGGLSTTGPPTRVVPHRNRIPYEPSERGPTGHGRRPSLPSCVRRRPTLPRSGPRSTIGAERLSFRVRDGTGRFPLAMVAETLLRYSVRTARLHFSSTAGGDRTSGTAQWTRSSQPEGPAKFCGKSSAY